MAYKEQLRDIRGSALSKTRKEAAYTLLWDTGKDAWTPDDLETLANYLRKVIPKEPGNALLREVIDTALARLDTFSIDYLAELAATYACICAERQYPQADYVAAIVKAAEAIFPGCQETRPLGRLAYALGKYAESGVSLPSEGISGLLSILTEGVQACMDSYSARNIANTLWALAKLNELAPQVRVGQEEAFSALLEALAGSIPGKIADKDKGFNAQDIANSLWALAKVRELAPEALTGQQQDTFTTALGALAGAIPRKIADKVEGFNAQAIANSLWALAKVRELAPEALTGQQQDTFTTALGALAGAIPRKIADKVEGFNAQAIANSLWALAKLDHPVPATLLREIALNSDTWLEGISDNEYYRENPTSLGPISRYLMRAMDLQPPVLLPKVRTAYRTFHLRFLRFCLNNANKRALEEVPKVLAALQGHKLAGLLLDYRPGFHRHAELVEDFRKVRATLRRLRLGHDMGLEESAISQQYLEYQELADELARAGLGHLLEGSLRVGVAEIQVSLGANEAALVLAEAPSRDEGSGGDDLLALVIGKRAVHHLELPGLGRLRAAITGYEVLQERQRGGRAWREGPRRPSDVKTGLACAEVNLEALTTLVAEVLWTPLTRTYSWIVQFKELRIITHGALHTLPYDLGFPGNEACLRHFPGLIFYYRHYGLGGSEALPAVPSTWHVGYAGYDAVDHPRRKDLENPIKPIPMVSAELALARRLWRQSRKLAAVDLTDSGAPLRLASLAGHGVTDSKLQTLYGLPEGPTEPDLPSALLFDHDAQTATDRLLGFNDALSWEPAPTVVLLSACVVGRVNEDPDGDPLGVVSGFLMQGARYVVGALQPVDDYYMPLLVCLFQQALKNERTPAEALSEAKRRLCTGDWYEDTHEHVRSIYTETIDTYRHRPEVDWPSLRGWSSVFRNVSLNDLKTGTDANWRGWIQGAVDDLIEQRSTLPVADLAASIRGFGAG